MSTAAASLYTELALTAILSCVAVVLLFAWWLLLWWARARYREAPTRGRRMRG